MIKFWFTFLVAFSLNHSLIFAQGNDDIDSLLLELADLEDKNDIENLGRKAILSNEIADLYNKLFSDQDHTRMYLLQSATFAEAKIKASPIPSAEDQLFLSDVYRKISLFEAFRGNKTVSDQYLIKCENQLKQLEFKLPKQTYDKAIFDFYHSCFALKFSTGDNASALNFLERADEILEKNENLYEFKINILSEISLCYSALGRFDEGVVAAKSALDLYYQNPPSDQPEDRFIYFYIKALFLANKNLEINAFIKKNPDYSDIIKMETYLIANKDLASRSFFELIFLLGNNNLVLYENTSEVQYLTAAYEWYLNGFILAEKLTLSNQGEKIGNSILRPKDKIVQLLQLYTLGIEHGELIEDKVVDIIRILDVYQSSRLHLERLSNVTNAENWGQEKALKNEVILINNRLKEIGRTDGDKLEYDSLAIRFNEIMVEWISLKKLTKRSKVLSEYEIDFSTFESKLKTYLSEKEKTLLVYFYDEKDSSLYILGHNPSSGFFKKNKLNHDFRATISSAYNLNSHFQIQHSDLSRQDSLNKILYSNLIEPIHEQITTKNLLIYPLNEIGYISFDALLSDSASYLINDYAIQYTSSLFALFSFEEVSISNPQLSSFYPSNYGTDTLAVLTHGKEEIKQIELTLSGTSYSGIKATKERFLELPASNQIIHIASHSNINFDRPYESCILFESNADSIENRLFAHEIFALNLNNELVTLSSCNTGSGKIEEGIGLVSLANAFSFAGVPATISSLWSAQDFSSSEIMISFYQNLKNGESKSESLRQAKLSFLSHSDKIKRQPFFWANYVVYGRDNSLFESNQGYKWYNYLIGIALTILLIIIGRRYFKSFNKA